MGSFRSEEQDSPLLVVLSGPSGVGKDTVIQAVKSSGFRIHHVVTATTRAPRVGERHGFDYYFVTIQAFDRMIADNELIEHAEVHGHRYGTPTAELRRAFNHGRDALLKIDVQGALQLKRRIPQAVFVFLAPPSTDDLFHRLLHRDTETPGERQRRIDDAHFELAQKCSYDYVIVNHAGSVMAAAGQLESIITAEKLRIHRQPIELPAGATALDVGGRARE